MTNFSTTEFISANENYLTEEGVSVLQGITDVEWPALLAALEVLNPGATDPGVDCVLVKTHETIDDFKKSRLTSWSERGSQTDHELPGFKAVEFHNLQMAKGKQRTSIVVLDLGDRRVVLR
mgnify:CR=1 FL=1